MANNRAEKNRRLGVKFGKVTTMAYWDLGLDLSLRNDSLDEISASLPKTSDN